jgi:hypothetical protein
MQRNKSKTFTKNSSEIMSSIKKVGTYLKSLTPTTLNFKLYPTAYQENTLNSNKFSQFKAFASFRLNARFSFYQINALSLTRFVFDYGVRQNLKQTQSDSSAKNKLSKQYLAKIERERLRRYRSTGIYIKDLVRVCFFSLFLKKAEFIATFFAFTISKLSRNRKELPFVRFLIQLLKTLSAQNKDILGIRIRFQGRLNR